MRNHFLVFVLTLFPVIANAAGVPTSFTYQGKALNAAGTAPLTSTVSFTLSITDPSSACVLYQESQTNVNLATTNGIFALQVGSLVGATKRVAGVDPGLTMTTIFANNGTQLISSNGSCPGYTPASNDVRKLHVVITPSSGSAITVSPDLTINAVPNALVAETLQGFTPTQLTTYSTPNRQILTTSGSYTTPLNSAGKAPLYLEIEMAGGGGGGAGGGQGSGSAAGTGGNTTFGSSLLTANGGTGGIWAGAGANGGTTTVGTGPVAFPTTGGTGGGSGQTGVSTTSQSISGGVGGTNPFGGAGSGGSGGYGTTGYSGVSNTGAGGGGGASGSGAGSGAADSGGGGGAGGYIKAIISSPGVLYNYSVGVAGTAGGAGTGGTGGTAGGPGGSGVIIVTAHYQ
jgi:hypothetical protein